MNSPSKPTPQTDRVLLGSLYVAEFALVLMGLALHKLSGRPITAWALSTPGLALFAAAGLLIAALTVIGRAYLKRAGPKSRGFGFTVAMNLITLALVLVPLEAALRWLSKETADVPVFVDTVLLPRSWDRAAAHYRRVVDKAPDHLSYILYNEALGWTVGPSRQSGDGLHLSSAEGLRSATRGAVLSGYTGKRRIAIVGDSTAFAQGVKFEDSWGHLLEVAFGPSAQVLNFGVPGYGVDQAYLKFKTEVMNWKPDAVVLAFPAHDLPRTMTVYPFINWVEWDWPYSKPRLVLEQGKLHSLNVPTIPPKKIFAARSVSELPFVEYDQGYNSSDWEQTVLDVLYVKRWLFQRFPRWSDKPTHAAEDERLRLNSAILDQFIRTARENRIVPLVVFFPTDQEITRRSRGEETSADRALMSLGIPIIDTTPCLMKAGDVQGLYLPNDSHYSPRGNAVIAKCVHAALAPMLEQQRTASVGR